MTRDGAIEHLHELTVAPLTTRLRNSCSQVFLDPSDGAARRSAVRCDAIRTIPKAKLGPSTTRLSRERLDRVREAAWFSLDLAPPS